MVGSLERALEADVVDAAEENATTPIHVYALFNDYPPAPALYGEFDVAVDGRVVDIPVIVHNLRYYELGMAEWDVGLVELIVLNELHELTHWAMTDEERTFVDRRSRRTRRPDGDWFNPTLLEVIDSLPGQYPPVVERPLVTSRVSRLRVRIRHLLTRLWKRARE
ncbi:hypothetical protein [Natronobiforma cellulositropha]|uniref:hypothetical protein n=1 Tax=Natronobiforma cellulositropha TaxID=1679076 RepID=UPI0021D56C75|nr:hypothetical protein [Natronobiforma cellulositropha]